jgi:hypothetical protein
VAKKPNIVRKTISQPIVVSVIFAAIKTTQNEANHPAICKIQKRIPRSLWLNLLKRVSDTIALYHLKPAKTNKDFCKHRIGSNSSSRGAISFKTIPPNYFSQLLKPAFI